MSDRVERSGAAGVVPSHQALILTEGTPNRYSRFPAWSNLARQVVNLSPATKAMLGVFGVPLAASLIGLGVLFVHNRAAHRKSRVCSLIVAFRLAFQSILRLLLQCLTLCVEFATGCQMGCY